MKRWLQQWLLVIPGVFLAEYAVGGIAAENWKVLLLVAAVLGALNVSLKPLLIFFALPFVIFTLGLGIIVINALLVMLAGAIVPGFEVLSFWSAFWGGLIISLASLFASALFGDRARFSVKVNRSSGSPRPRRQQGKNRGDVIDV
jgi:putative membrane protein